MTGLLEWVENEICHYTLNKFILDNSKYYNLKQELNDFRSKCGTLLKFDWISLPLVYTQVSVYKLQLI